MYLKDFFPKKKKSLLLSNKEDSTLSILKKVSIWHYASIQVHQHTCTNTQNPQTHIRTHAHMLASTHSAPLNFAMLKRFFNSLNYNYVRKKKVFSQKWHDTDFSHDWIDTLQCTCISTKERTVEMFSFFS